MSRFRTGLTAVAAIALVATAPQMLFAGNSAAVSPAQIAARPGPVSTAVAAQQPAPAAHKLIGEPVLVAAVPVTDEPTQPAPGQSPAAEGRIPAAEAPAKVVPPKPETTLAIDIDLSSQHMTLTENGTVVGSWPISSGRAGFRSPAGTYHPLWMSKMWYSKKYDNAPMPNAVFFSGGVAMHATQAVGQLGHPASHGCIRQSPANAATTFKLVQKHGNAHTRIVVHGTPHDYEPRVARNERNDHHQPGIVMTAMPSPSMRRVIIVDGWGNRRVTDLPANDPRLVSYQQRRSQW